MAGVVTEILFYHMQRQPLEKVLPNLVERSLDRGWQAAIQAATEERLQALDDHLWTYSDESFLPHGTDREPDAAGQPVVLTLRDVNPNTASIRFLVEGADLPPDAGTYERICILFDGTDQDALLRAREQWKQAKEAGGGIDGRARVMYGVMGEVEARLMGPVGCTSVSWLDSPALAAAIRTGFAPGDRAGLTAADIDAQTDPKVAAALPMAAAGPTSTPNPERRFYAHDAWQSVTCTILLPDKGAVMGALAPVFTPTTAGERRSVTVFFEPIPAGKADRIVGNESMSSELASEMRRKGGFKVRAAHRRDAARVEGQDVRLADGNALVRVAIAAAVTVPNTWSITDYGRRLESNITGSGFKPLRLDLAQDTGFAAACIPLGIGLPKRRGVK